MLRGQPVAVILIGRPYSGKTTIVKALEQAGYKICIMSKALEHKTMNDPVFAGKYPRKLYMDAGVLYPDPEPQVALEEYICGFIGENIVLDGVVRTSFQADSVEVFLTRRGYTVKYIYLTCSLEVALSRVASRIQEHRAQGKPVRPDDLNMEKIMDRQGNFDQNLPDVLRAIVNQSHSIHAIDGAQTSNAVAEQALAIAST